MQIKCSGCQKPLEASEVNLALGIASCSGCNKVFHLGEANKPSAPVSRAKREQKVALPEKFTVEEEMGELRIHRRWFRFIAFFFLIRDIKTDICWLSSVE